MSIENHCLWIDSLDPPLLNCRIVATAKLLQLAEPKDVLHDVWE